MGKIHTITAVVSYVFVIIMLFILAHPLDFLDKDVESFYHTNQGAIWFICIGISGFLMMMTYINGQFQRDLKHCSIISDEKTDQINEYNKEILAKTLIYIEKIEHLTESINENIAMVNKQNETIDKVYKRIEDSEGQIKKIIKLLEEHDDEIKELKKK